MPLLMLACQHCDVLEHHLVLRISTGFWGSALMPVECSTRRSCNLLTGSLLRICARIRLHMARSCWQSCQSGRQIWGGTMSGIVITFLVGFVQVCDKIDVFGLTCGKTLMVIPCPWRWISEP